MKIALTQRLDAGLAHYLPEQRLYLRSDTQTRFIRLRPHTQLVAISCSALVVAWALFSSAILLMDSIGRVGLRDQAARKQAMYEERLNIMAEERDLRASEAGAAQKQFSFALGEISKMQSELLSSEERRRELETGLRVVQSTLRRTMSERDTAREAAALARRELAEATGTTRTRSGQMEDLNQTLAFLSGALEQTAGERDTLAVDAHDAQQQVEQLNFERALMQQRNDRIFEKLEEALTVSVEPLDRMFRKAGLPPEKLISQVRSGYSGQGGPLMPLRFSTKGEAPSTEELRAQNILEGLDKMNLYRIAAHKAPFSIPVKGTFRFTSGFGPRWGRMHNGTDFAAAHGSPIYSTADGVVVHAGWSSGYGRLIKIQHDFGIETRYAHLSKIRVQVGQRVSRGDQIGDMGNSGRSTGTHLHYEVRVGGKPVNPMTYIKAARDVF